MTPKEWQRVKAVLAEAVERTGDDRRVYLDEACENDEALRREVESLLVSGSSRAAALERQPWGDSVDSVSTSSSKDRVTRTLGPDSPGRPPIEAIGPYKVAQELGQGGMGAVFLALRDDDQYRKRVAIKILRPGMESEDILRRFRVERQILAAIDHPYVAKLLDGGSTSDGHPYLVMDFIEGKPIDEYCDAKRLPIGDRLTLFRKVCSAVHFAHQNLVVHRDLKPGNILVTSDGTPKLLDFGIAKLLNPELSLRTVELTRFEVRLMTPEFASPEQVQGEPITTASDIYSLGVLLYGLLTGHRPYQFKSPQLAEIVRVICEEEPRAPSLAVGLVEEVRDASGRTTLVTPASVSRTREGSEDRLRRRLKGDLDTIVLTAMRKEPQRRYASAEQLSEDIRRYLEGLPIKARRSTWTYKSTKFVRRHGMGIAAMAIVMVFLLAFALVAAQERRQAQREAAKARAVVEFLTSTLAAIDPRIALGTEPTVRSMLDEAQKRLDSRHGLPFHDAAAIRRTIAESRFQLGHFAEAEREFARLLAETSGTLGEGHSDAVDARIGLAAAQAELNKLRDAEANARLALGHISEARPSPTQLVRVESTLARVLLLSGTAERLGEADRILTRATELARSSLPVEHADRVGSFASLADLRLAQARYREAEQLASANYASVHRFFGPSHPATLQSFDTLSSCLRALNRYTEVLTLQGRHLEDTARVLGADHVRTLQARATLASTLRALDRFEEAESVYEDLLARQSRTLGDFHPATLRTRHELALLQKDLGNPRKAEEMLRQLLVVEREKLGAEHEVTLSSELMIALALYHGGRLAESRDAYAAVLPRVRESLGEHASLYLVGMSNYAGLYYRLGDNEGAESMFRESLAVHRRVYGDDNFGVYYNRMELGTTLLRLGKYAEAEAELLGALQGFQRTFSSRPDHQRIRSAHDRLIQLYGAWGKPDEARKHSTILQNLKAASPPPAS
jgi:serine/threonine-protein kinase